MFSLVNADERFSSLSSSLMSFIHWRSECIHSPPLGGNYLNLQLINYLCVREQASERGSSSAVIAIIEPNSIYRLSLSLFFHCCWVSAMMRTTMMMMIHSAESERAIEKGRENRRRAIESDIFIGKWWWWWWCDRRCVLFVLPLKIGYQHISSSNSNVLSIISITSCLSCLVLSVCALLMLLLPVLLLLPGFVFPPSAGWPVFDWLLRSICILLAGWLTKGHSPATLLIVSSSATAASAVRKALDSNADDALIQFRSRPFIGLTVAHWNWQANSITITITIIGRISGNCN